MAGRAKAPQASKSKLEFLVDARLELDGVMELLAFDLTKGGKGKPHATDFMHPDIAYVREARKHFAKFKDHPAIKRRAQPAFRAFDVGQRGQGLLRLSPVPELAAASQISISFLAHYVGGEAQLEQFLQDLRDFARDSKFMEFFEAKKHLLDPDLARVRAEIEKMDYIGKLEAYTGLPFEGRYAFILSPFVACDTGANVVQRGEDGLADIVSVVGPTEDSPKEGPISCTYPRLHCRAWHEAAHGVLDNVTELFGAEIALKQPPAREASREYQNWMHHVREHMVRTVMLRLASREVGADYSDHELAHEEECGLPYLREFKAVAIEFEKNRAKYKTIAEFYPKLIGALPAPPKGAARPLDRENEPYRDRITETGMPFYTEGQRRRAVWYLDLILERCDLPSLRLKRAALNSLLGRAEEAAADARAVLAARPGDEVAALIAKGGGASPRPAGPGVEKAPPGREDPPRRSPELARLNEEGMAAYLKGKHAAALAKLETALRAAPGDVQTQINLAVVYGATGEETKALAAFTKAIDACLCAPSPESRASAAAALSSRASLHERAKRRKEARADLERALQLAPYEWDQRAAIEKRLKVAS